jgi:hypothetical protein
VKQEIKSKWYSEKYGVAVTESGEVIRISDMIILRKEYSCNRVVFRAARENKRIGAKSLRESLTRKEVVIQNYCPF